MRKDISKILIGSSIALMGGSSLGHAADAIILEPEPIERVRICDVYGNGYFYIPGTETCLGISGYVRTTYKHIDRHIKRGHELGTFNDKGVFRVTEDDHPRDANDSGWSYRGRLNLQFKSETEYGTLSSYLRLQGTGSDGYSDATERATWATISLAGFKGGYADSYWKTNHNGGAGSPAINDGYYGDDNSLYGQYTYAFDGFAITGGVQQQFKNDSVEYDNTVDWYAGINWKTDISQIAFTAAHDGDEDDMAYKTSAIFNLGNHWQLGGWYAWENNGKSRFIHGNLGDDSIGAKVLDEEWGVQINGSLTENVSLYGVYSEASGDDQNYSDIVGDKGFRYWTVGTRWDPVANLGIVLEYNNERRKADLGEGAVYNDDADKVYIRAIRSW